MRFAFGKNWQSYSQNALTPERVKEARQAFCELVAEIDLPGKRFIDIGFGQGLTLILAAESGASVIGIDIDEDNMRAMQITSKALECKQIPEVHIASILDAAFLETNKKGFDIVHSWGVLHHTGDMKKAIKGACTLVAERGYFICSIYNKHWSSPLWKIIKWSYNKVPVILQRLIVGLLYPVIYVAKWIVTRRNPKTKERGMDFFHDVVDWVGGYPYEYATEKEICTLIEVEGFKCLRIKSAQTPTGCNEFVFQKGTQFIQ